MLLNVIFAKLFHQIIPLTSSENPSLTALSPLDGRYHASVAPLIPYFSEWGLFRYRIRVEWEYLEALCDAELPQGPRLDTDLRAALRERFLAVGPEDVAEIKHLEKDILHDIKAMEYWMKARMDEFGASDAREWVHFGLTSQDINHCAVPLSLAEGMRGILMPAWRACTLALKTKAESWMHLPMLARTHGQPASPTRLGKELRVWVERLERQYTMLEHCPIGAKFGGATGNFNAHALVWPDTDWHRFGNNLVEGRWGLTRYRYTTQIEHYDYLAALCHNLIRMNHVLLDACRDLWQYISLGYFVQELREGQVGSSAMPHKVNPIDFENAEGNLGVANSLLEHLAHKLPVSRLQRDLSDSTVLRNLGVPLGHSLLALESFSKGLSKIHPDPVAMHADLDRNWAVLAEGIQTVLRAKGMEAPYEKLKAHTRTGQAMDAPSLLSLIESLDLDPATASLLRQLRPELYLGQLPTDDGQPFPH